jgi:hypothetical protein
VAPEFGLEAGLSASASRITEWNLVIEEGIGEERSYGQQSQ